jgi:phosphatidate cytidylyltransferase
MADDNSTAAPPAKKSDLPVRVVSAVVMLAVAGTCLSLGGVWQDGLILLVVLAALCELILLITKITDALMFRAVGILTGAIYVSVAGAFLIKTSTIGIILVVGSVICVDVFAYFFGRSIGGPKIAPKISPSKTWAGLGGGAVGAFLFMVAFRVYFWAWEFGGLRHVDFGAALHSAVKVAPRDLPLAGLIAVIAQSGDFLECWLKRRAGVMDGSGLIPGHGGVFDRVDGLIAVCFVIAIVELTVHAISGQPY